MLTQVYSRPSLYHSFSLMAFALAQRDPGSTKGRSTADPKDYPPPDNHNARTVGAGLIPPTNFGGS